MQILEIREERRNISNARLGDAHVDISGHIYRLNWREDQLSGKQKEPDSLKDIKQGMDAQRKKAKKKKDKAAMKK